MIIIISDGSVFTDAPIDLARLTENQCVTIDSNGSTVHEMVVLMEPVGFLRKQTFVKMKFPSNLIARHILMALLMNDSLNKQNDGLLMLVEDVRKRVAEFGFAATRIAIHQRRVVVSLQIQRNVVDTIHRLGSIGNRVGQKKRRVLHVTIGVDEPVEGHLGIERFRTEDR